MSLLTAINDGDIPGEVPAILADTFRKLSLSLAFAGYGDAGALEAVGCHAETLMVLARRMERANREKRLAA